MNNPIGQATISLLDYTLVRCILSPQALEQLARGNISNSEFSPFLQLIAALSERYVTSDSEPIVSESEAKAYALYYTPINFTKLALLLATLSPFGAERLRILDFGCGPGTASLACLASLPYAQNVVAVDRSAGMRALAQAAIPGFSDALSGKSAGHLESLQLLGLLPETHDPFDLIIAANVLNELSTAGSNELLNSLVNRLANNGILLLLEPALLAPTRSLMASRDFLIAKHSQLVPIFPCTHRRQCPMRAQSKHDWCHGSLEGNGRDFASSQLVRQIDSLLGFNKHRIKYSAIILQRGGSLRGGYRVLRDAERSPQGVSANLCGDDFYGIATLSKRASPDKKRAVRKLRQFMHLKMSSPAAKMLDPDSEIETSSL